MWQIAIRRLEMPMGRFLGLYVGAICRRLTCLTHPYFRHRWFCRWSTVCRLVGILLLFLLPILQRSGALAFPLLEVSRSANLIEREMHMFITRMGILSLGEVGAQSIFDILKQMRDYGELATEVQRIETLVDKWHTSLPEAARIVAQQSPKPTYGRIFSIEWPSRLKQVSQLMNSCVRNKKRLLNNTTHSTILDRKC